MNVRKSDDFIGDVERQYEWYFRNAGEEVAELYLNALQVSCNFIGQQPLIGPRSGLSHPRLREWRFFLVFRPFQKHVIFYEAGAQEIILRRTMHGHRNLPRRLLDLPENG
jgi:plasmid stabilization system protein ParE